MRKSCLRFLLIQSLEKGRKLTVFLQLRKKKVREKSFNLKIKVNVNKSQICVLSVEITVVWNQFFHCSCCSHCQFFCGHADTMATYLDPAVFSCRRPFSGHSVEDKVKYNNKRHSDLFRDKKIPNGKGPWDYGKLFWGRMKKIQSDLSQTSFYSMLMHRGQTSLRWIRIL